MDLRDAIRRAWDAHRRLRWLAYTLGGLGGMGVGGGLLALAYRWRRLGELRTDSPEYANGESLLPRVEWPHMMLPAWLPWLIPPLLILLLAWLATHIPMRRPDNGFDRDPRRAFTDADREWIDSCTGRRCEYRTMFGLKRCRYAAEQLDHWYPWAKGGATDRHNLADLCARHNRRKTDHVPTWLQTAMLAHARMRYFPPRWRAYVRPDGLAHDKDMEADDGSQG